MDNTSNINETLDVLARILSRCVIMCAIVLLFWFAAIWFAGDLAYKAHSTFVNLSRESFNTIQYAGALIFKALASMIFVIPYIAIKLVQKKRRSEDQ